MEDSRRRRNGGNANQQGSSRVRGAWIVIGLVSISLLGLLFFLLSGTGEEEAGVRFPQIGDHWHADYSITICGEEQAILPYTDGGIHTHGDGVIHLHPKQMIESGRNANIARFMATAGGSLTDELIELPNGEIYKNGHICPNGNTGRLFLKVNGILSKETSAYVPRDEDVLEFGIKTN
ncbi:MAG: hypothetical protein CL787_04225 [Chloroflexi bacterium]|nr:hypothetical protein [Chloroflexota bacterium]MQF99964.1 hypothetical protein [SAR202 cluster bacterium]|tara:strand:- start:2839 stop:3372 length:534 start_codon:yes stop_codon:yes gene_type:complete